MFSKIPCFHHFLFALHTRNVFNGKLFLNEIWTNPSFFWLVGWLNGFQIVLLKIQSLHITITAIKAKKLKIVIKWTIHQLWEWNLILEFFSFMKCNSIDLLRGQFTRGDIHFILYNFSKMDSIFHFSTFFHIFTKKLDKKSVFIPLVGRAINDDNFPFLVWKMRKGKNLFDLKDFSVRRKIWVARGCSRQDRHICQTFLLPSQLLRSINVAEW